MAIIHPNLTLATIEERLQIAYQPDVVASKGEYLEMDKDSPLKCAAVLIPFVWWKEGWHLVFTHRTDAVEHHKDQVSFPGGGCNVDESTPEETALREAEEEIGLKSVDVRLLGRLNEVITITRYRIKPVVGVMPWPYKLTPEHAEVQRIFTIPLLWLAQKRNWKVQLFKPDGIDRTFPVIIYQPYDGEILWGASAKITHDLLSVLDLLPG
jgi:8-oxo-dGTP pyrophosphatase MutT (NUDIX family)